MVGQMRTWIPRLDLLELLARLSAGPSFKLDGKLRTLFGAASIILGMSVSSSALADVEEVSSQDQIASDYTQHALSPRSIIYFFGNNYDDLTGSGRVAHYSLLNNTSYGAAVDERYQVNMNNSLGDKYHSANITDNFENIFIPETVWNLDNISGESSSSFVDPNNIPYSWSSLRLSITDNQNVFQETFHLSPSQFQTASCLETNYLDHCDDRNNSITKRAVSLQPGTQDNGDDNVISPNSTSTPSQEHEPDTFHSLSRLMPASANDFLLEGASLTTFQDQDQCDDMFVVCPATQIKPSAPPIDSALRVIVTPTAVTADPPDSSDPAPPDQTIYYVGSPAPVFDPLPISTQPPTATTVPETSTEIMTIIGFVATIIYRNRKVIRSLSQGIA